MVQQPPRFERKAHSVQEIRDTLASLNVHDAVLKLLPKNANDKNQIYVGSDAGILLDIFSMGFQGRGDSSSGKKSKKGTNEGRGISEAVFESFHWLRSDGAFCQGKRVKAIIYPQYPEARLSGFQTIDGSMPESLSVNFTQANPDAKRLLVLGARGRGECVGIIYWGVTPELEAEIKALPGAERAKACKHIRFNRNGMDRLMGLLRPIVKRPLLGCRLDNSGRTLAFSGTQVCGYTLEHSLGIRPNSGKDGDIFGIELKTYTSKKLTLFTPEPDFGLYADSFSQFMTQYGYRDKSGDLRLTGVHRAEVPCTSSGLVLRVTEYRMDDEGQWIRDEKGRKKHFPYDQNTPLSSKVDALQVVLLDAEENVAAGWSFERLMNCWGAKHNEVVYIPAVKEDNQNKADVEAGFEFVVTYSPTIMLCRKTSAERLFKAIDDGVIFLDPAPKLHATDASKNKRRAQWRVNDIEKAAMALYEHVEFVTLDPVR